MLREYKAIRQLKGEPRRRFFSDERFQLYVWYEPDGSVHGFQLLVGEPDSVKLALTWKVAGGYLVSAVDEADGDSIYNAAPVLWFTSSKLDKQAVLGHLEQAGGALEPELSRLLREKAASCPG